MIIIALISGVIVSVALILFFGTSLYYHRPIRITERGLAVMFAGLGVFLESLRASYLFLIIGLGLAAIVAILRLWFIARIPEVTVHDALLKALNGIRIAFAEKGPRLFELTGLGSIHIYGGRALWILRFNVKLTKKTRLLMAVFKKFVGSNRV